MGEKTKIPWCHHTFNPWWGCTKVSAGCDHCYAERLAVRYGFQLWGTEAPRRTFSEKHWREPLKWNADAANAGERRRVFCGSMCDLFEARAELDHLLANVLGLIHQTPQLDWLLLTKRPELFEARMSAAASCGGENGELAKGWAGGEAIPNVWMLTTVENETVARGRVDALLKIPSAIHGISAEPLLSPFDVPWFPSVCPVCCRSTGMSVVGARGSPDEPFSWFCRRPACARTAPPLPKVDWLIIGCESGPWRRRCEKTWVRNLVAQAGHAGVPTFVKQLEINGRIETDRRRWPEDLRIQEFPLL
jgi:protein gp37